MTTVELPIALNHKKMDTICRQFHVRQLLLFGSVLRSDFDRESDADVLVEFAPDAMVTFTTLSRLQRALSELWGCDVDLVPKAGLEALIRDAVLEQSQEIYAS